MSLGMFMPLLLWAILHDSLSIRVNRAENGQIYTCQAELDLEPHIFIQSNAAINITVEYEPTLMVTEDSFEYELGETVTLVCSCDGNPAPNILWNSIPRAPNVRTIRGRHNPLVITGATSTNVGVYNCTACNFFGVFPNPSRSL
ncbi:cell adhesion molecule 4 [Phycodurus eques]|uniref:cell adhesion molecule 4 n=1 Tax=Phycodurus eques TaxID=693459 RepID=UPI002ACD65DE|nr:cell adhesion molecule 4 [Phycodurus eques]